MKSLGLSFVLLTSLLKVRIPIPVTMNMLIVGVVGIILTAILSVLPGPFKLLSGIAALATIVLVIMIGIDDYRGGDLVDRATGSDCAGWNGYVGTVDQLRTDYDGILQRTNASYLSPNEAESLARETNTLADRLTNASPPEAASGIHNNLLSVFEETERQLWNYSAGQYYDPTQINSMLDRQNLLIDTANEKCG